MDRRTIDYYERNSREYSFPPPPTSLRMLLTSFSHASERAAEYSTAAVARGVTADTSSLGYTVDMIDASEGMCRIAAGYTGLDAVCMDYMDLKPSVLYSGIWAQASLLHERRGNLRKAFTVLSSCLEDEGVLYASFRYGGGERREGERWYTDMDEDSFHLLLPDGMDAVKMWQSSDVRPLFSYRWFNVILRKVKK